MRRLPYYIVCLWAVCVLIGCTGNGYTPALQAIDSLMNDSPDSALSMLKGMSSEIPDWSKAQRMRYHLLTMKAQNKAYVNFTSDSLAKEVVEYYDNHGTFNDRLLAHYLLGCVYRDLGEAPKALQAYYDALEKIDTLTINCDANTLAWVYGQMSQVFHQQDLPYDEIWALRHYSRCIERTGDIRRTIIAKSQLVRPYYLLGEKDSVLKLIGESYQTLKLIGDNQSAAEMLPTAIYIYTERKELLMAGQMVDAYEKESGLFDEKGNIAKGREHYYVTKGFYKLAIHEIDSAEAYFRKAIHSGFLSDGYKGLLSVYRQKNVLDSIVHFSLLFEDAQDSLHNNMQIEAIHRMSSLYTYNRYQKQAVENAWKVSWAIGVISALVLAFTAITIIVVVLWRKKKEIHRKQVEAFNKLKDEYDDGKERLRKAKEDLEIMEASLNENNTEQAQLLEKKNSEILSYLEQIKVLETKLKIGNRKVTKKELMDTPIYQRIQEVLSHPKQKMLKEDWTELRSMIDEKIPSFYSEMNSHKGKLSQQDYDICILVRLYLSPKEIVILTNSTSSAISMKRGRLLKKIFGIDGSPEKFDEMVQNIF